MQDTSKEFYLIDVHSEVIKDQYVLAPSKANYDSALVNGLSSSIFVFYPRKVIVNSKDSVTLKQIGDTVTLPSSLVIPLSENAKATKGDIVLTWWQSGTGMQRAIALNKDTSTTPTVYYLDNQYSFYSKATDINFWIDTLKPNSFIVLDDNLSSGKSIYVKKDYFSVFYTVINQTADSVLALSWAGLLEVFANNEFFEIDINQQFSIGDSVFTPYYGTYTKGVVKEIWPDIGKITVDVFFIDSYVEIYANMIDTYKESYD